MRRLLEWLDLQDSDARKPARALGPTLTLGVIIVALIGVTSSVPPVARFFQLRAEVPGVLYAGLFSFALVLALYERRHTVPSRLIAAVEVLYALGFELFVVTLFSYSELPGAGVFAGFAFFTTTWYGYAFRVSPRYPWHALASALVYLGGGALNPAAEHVAILAVVGSTAVLAKLVVGSWALQGDAHRAEREQLRAAIDAQMLDDQANRIAALADMLLDLVSRNHDVRNAVMAATVGAETLQILAEGERLDAKRGTIDEIARNLEGSLDRVKLLLTDISALGRDHLAEIVPDHVRMKPVLARIVADVQRRFPLVRLEVEDLPADTMVRVAGGEVTLARIVENAVVNACEGNGTEHASHVHVRVEGRSQEPYVRLRVKDDGPGFAPELVEAPIRGFFTTKDSGTGLGLYTLERLARASGGRVARENDGGALLTIELLRCDDVAA